MASLLDTVGGPTGSIGFPGAQADNSLAEFDTFSNEATTGGLDSNGMIDLGVIVAKGSQDKTCVPYATVDGSQRPIGITSRLLPFSPAVLPANLVGYQTGKAIGIYRTGDVICLAAEDVREGDQVCAIAVLTVSTGVTTNVCGTQKGVANATTRVAMPGHVWKTTTKAGKKGVVSVFRRDGMAVLTS